ncbi:hypothetical protein BDF22DRAFT_62517 [Syncephalis plumigaleata]|nr:hypothetical protein BDF22DRAFT_62517 [Syncephalis plumigaleata]
MDPSNNHSTRVTVDTTYNEVGQQQQQEKVEEEDEEFHVIIDLGSEITPTILDNAIDYEFMRLDTPEPILRIGIHYFKGAWDLMVGTDIVFADSEEDSAKVVAHTSKILRCQLMQLQPKCTLNTGTML